MEDIWQTNRFHRFLFVGTLTEIVPLSDVQERFLDLANGYRHQKAFFIVVLSRAHNELLSLRRAH